MKQIPDTNDWDFGNGMILRNVHSLEECSGPCPFHGPSDHLMRDWPAHYMVLKGRLYACVVRICEHHVPHPDPDTHSHARDVLGLARTTTEHEECDGCCFPEKTQQKLV